MDWEVVVKHSYREVNQCADALASYGVALEDGFCFYETCPAHLSQLLVADVMGISVPRPSKLAPDKIDPETLRRNIHPSPKSISPDQPMWLHQQFKKLTITEDSQAASRISPEVVKGANNDEYGRERTTRLKVTSWC
ncbi:ethylene responsive transcription factor 1b [Trifolium medium]|uniref:Ethylene responsive transcription factor 1b n=1 Tax=Trifolium medium TaxID=97028 RepID=A0A392N8F5_9FABA|nr:ethylene responsive transcription factor 1b [Trifolium medium]